MDPGKEDFPDICSPPPGPPTPATHAQAEEFAPISQWMEWALAFVRAGEMENFAAYNPGPEAFNL
jgi:hypothetical protein